jgi:hypothetical protein
MIGVAIGAFHWSGRSAFVSLKQALVAACWVTQFRMF